jgi:hypothetical protein
MIKNTILCDRDMPEGIVSLYRFSFRESKPECQLGHYRMKEKTLISQFSGAHHHHKYGWVILVQALHAACVLIYIAVFRVVEFVHGNYGPVVKREYL